MKNVTQNNHLPEIESFKLDHTKVKAPFVRVAGILPHPTKPSTFITKFDIRFTQPNKEFIPSDALHTLEHLLATNIRKYTQNKDDMIDISPMGCRTGFYCTFFNKKDPSEIASIINKALQDVLKAQEIPGATEKECGNYKEHSLDGAKVYAQKFLNFSKSDLTNTNRNDFNIHNEFNGNKDLDLGLDLSNKLDNATHHYPRLARMNNNQIFNVSNRNNLNKDSLDDEKIESFKLDHTVVSAPFIRKAAVVHNPNFKDAIVSKFDIRFTQPNKEFIPNGALHTLEHLLATNMRKYTQDMIDISPMGCRTGFYCSFFNDNTPKEVAKIIQSSLRDVLSAKTIPGATEKECGNYKEHDLEGAKKFARKFLELSLTDILNLNRQERKNEISIAM